MGSRTGGSVSMPEQKRAIPVRGRDSDNFLLAHRSPPDGLKAAGAQPAFRRRKPPMKSGLMLTSTPDPAIFSNLSIAVSLGLP